MKDNCIIFTRDAICVVLSVDVYKPIRNYNQAVSPKLCSNDICISENSNLKIQRRNFSEVVTLNDVVFLDILIKGIFKISIFERY